jgi:hypothetical protein
MNRLIFWAIRKYLMHRLEKRYVVTRFAKTTKRHPLNPAFRIQYGDDFVDYTYSDFYGAAMHLTEPK